MEAGPESKLSQLGSTDQTDAGPSKLVTSPSGSGGEAVERKRHPKGKDPKLRYFQPYWWPYRTWVKERWIGRGLLEVVSTEFRDRSVDYYRHALESGVTRVNGVPAGPDFILKNGDRIDNTVHRHEPPITNDPILVLKHDEERGFVVISKPGSIPVHPTGRYYRHTVLELMESDHSIKCFSVNRLDRLTSGLMILALSGQMARKLSEEFSDRTVQKEYIARVRGQFPEGLIEVNEPLLTVDRQMGLVIVTPEGKEAKTLFRRMSYDRERDQSLIHCCPLTGRTHQIRVHLQYLGYPIANDPLYSQPAIWGSHVGKGGVDLVPSHGASQAEAIASRVVGQPSVTPSTLGTANGKSHVDLDDREYANIDITSPIPLSAQAREIIAKLRRQRDEQEDWIKWKEVVFRVKEAQDALDSSSTSRVSTPYTPEPVDNASTPDFDIPKRPNSASLESENLKPHPKSLPQDQTALPATFEDTASPLNPPEYLPPGFCPQCFVPLPDDPDPETLFIYLHALRYTTQTLGNFETPLPKWAEAGWEGDWRGWSEQKARPPFATLSTQ